ncbi:hypothetical protein JHK82_019119 [Glycine max]|nr:hypothetical protein JHK85_019559 [Glycine max]KAG5038301.1 hypothetical protein JHK86_019141 [Glycine max]KAG5143424.1 hypothetical protein JHK82_019119 [Glycine max]
MLLEEGGNSDVDQPLFLELFIVMQFSLQKLQDPEFVFKLESREDTAVIQCLTNSIGGTLILLIGIRAKAYERAFIKNCIKEDPTDLIFSDEIKELQQKVPAASDFVIEARHKEEERATLNPPHAIRNGYDILNPNSPQQSQPQPQHMQ